MMFLIKNYDDTLINTMLVSLICPFGYYQPYVPSSLNNMPPEIFMGRKTELESIRDMNGANIVYGGRQLGKSALLKKARDVTNSNARERAVYIDIWKLDYRETARKISNELYDLGILKEDLNTTDWDVLIRAIKNRLRSQDEPEISYLLLLLDEADSFIASREQVELDPIGKLAELQETQRFKFVIAGLRNVVRFNRDPSLKDNAIMPKLTSITVKPFNIAEARELLEIPLYYLGLRFPREKESLITLILATTNYFPGLIQLYCAKLIDAMKLPDYAGYTEENSPPYMVSEDHIKKVLADPSFTTEIYTKFDITLRLGEDNYYKIIALLLACLYHKNGYSSGYTAQDIRDISWDLSITRIASMGLEQVSALMEEMRELNVLRNTDETHYLFNRFSFFQMMGTITQVDDELMKYMEE